MTALVLLACAARTAPPAERPSGEEAPAEAAWTVPEGIPGGALTCVSEAHPLTYEGWRKSGGAMPVQGIPMGGETWTWGAQTLYTSQDLYGGEGEVTGALTWTWDHSGAALVSETPGNLSRTTVYTTSVTVTNSDGAPLAEGQGPTLTAAVTCTRQEVWGIP